MARESFIRIDSGVLPDQVLQRGQDGTATISFGATTTAPDSARLEARLLVAGQPLPGYGWRPVARSPDGACSGYFADVPIGGPYTVCVRVLAEDGTCLARTECPGLLVGDLWILAGQSNMGGSGRLDSPAVPPPHVLVHAFDMSDRWTPAVEPLHWRIQSVDPVHWFEDDVEASEGMIEMHHRDRAAGVGPGLAFARHVANHTGVPVGLIPCALGGSSMDQWDPALRDRGGRSLYGALLRRHAAVGGRVRGVLWYQGESDAGGGAADALRDKMRRLVASLRSDLGQEALPFFCVQLGRFFEPLGEKAGWNKVREAQRLLPEDVPHADVVTAIDLSLDDHIHISSEGQARLGKRLATAALRHVYDRVDLQPGPHPVRVTVESPVLLRVEYAGVNNGLRPQHDIHGFSLRDESGGSLRRIFRADVDPGRPDTVLLRLWPELTEDAFLWYGYGLHPVCNLTDEQDMGALAFGPWLVCGPSD